jgi:membrane protein implicated in regulation of membrane protease activity
MSTIIGLLVGAAIALPGNFLAVRHPAFAEPWYAAWAIICTGLAALNAAQHDWAWTALMIVCAVVNALSWWNSRKRRKRKRAAALAGAKSRARIQALVAKLRATRRTRPVLKPIPDGQP